MKERARNTRRPHAWRDVFKLEGTQEVVFNREIHASSERLSAQAGKAPSLIVLPALRSRRFRKARVDFCCGEQRVWRALMRSVE